MAIDELSPRVKPEDKGCVYCYKSMGNVIINYYIFHSSMLVTANDWSGFQSHGNHYNKAYHDNFVC